MTAGAGAADGTAAAVGAPSEGTAAGSDLPDAGEMGAGKGSTGAGAGCSTCTAAGSVSSSALFVVFSSLLIVAEASAASAEAVRAGADASLPTASAEELSAGNWGGPDATEAADAAVAPSAPLVPPANSTSTVSANVSALAEDDVATSADSDAVADSLAAGPSSALMAGGASAVLAVEAVLVSTAAAPICVVLATSAEEGAGAGADAEDAADATTVVSPSEDRAAVDSSLRLSAGTTAVVFWPSVCRCSSSTGLLSPTDADTAADPKVCSLTSSRLEEERADSARATEASADDVADMVAGALVEMGAGADDTGGLAGAAAAVDDDAI